MSTAGRDGAIWNSNCIELQVVLVSCSFFRFRDAGPFTSRGFRPTWCRCTIEMSPCCQPKFRDRPRGFCFLLVLLRQQRTFQLGQVRKWEGKRCFHTRPALRGTNSGTFALLLLAIHGGSRTVLCALFSARLPPRAREKDSTEQNLLSVRIPGAGVPGLPGLPCIETLALELKRPSASA